MPAMVATPTKDSPSEIKDWNGFLPGASPRLSDGREFPAPILVLEGFERFPGDGRVDRLQRPGQIPPVVP